MDRFRSGDLLMVGAFRLVADGVAGAAERARAAGAGGDRDPAGTLAETLADAGLPAAGSDVVAAAVADAGGRAVDGLALDDLLTGGAPGGTRGTDDRPVVELSVEAPPDDSVQVLVEVDATGVLRWHLPAPVTLGPGPDRAADRQVFRVPVEQLSLPEEGASDRGILAYGVRKVLQLVRFPVRAAAGAGGRALVSWWERRYRPYRLVVPVGPGLDELVDSRKMPDSQREQFHAGPVLLLVHGTFSTGSAAFRGLAADPFTAAEVYHRYAGRILVFDHPTVHVAPADNAAWLLAELGPYGPLDLDVVAHSRGGLVARSLLGARSSPSNRLTLRRLVHVATPNAGTVLASEERLGSLVDVLSNVLALFPDDTIAAPMQAVVEVVKQLALGVLEDLDGLTAMDPAGPELAALNAADDGARERYAITTDFDGASGRVPLRALDALVDTLFATANDLVVPTEGVHSAGGYRIADPLVVPSSAAIAHTTFFREPVVRSQLLEWLTP